MAQIKREVSHRIGRRELLKGAAAAAIVGPHAGVAELGPSATAKDDRAYWVRILTRIGDPVLRSLSEHKLKLMMPADGPNGAERSQFMHLEALGRLLAGMGPWLELNGNIAEKALRAQYAELARAAIDASTDPASPDFMNFTRGGQPLVDAAFLALGILRAPTELWQKLPGNTKRNVVRALQSTRAIKPPYNNWILFSATVEAFLAQVGEDWDPARIDFAVRGIESFYKGDGVYGDGPEFHWDYYNSFVIHPLLLCVLDTISGKSSQWQSFQPGALDRARRFAIIQERMIGPDGSFPAIGRSLAYRCGAFHHLAAMALRHQLPEGVTRQQVRCALTAVMRRMMEAPGTFDANGWLNIGFCGHQPEIAERYISRGSSYLCSVAWLPLGLPPGDSFWSAPAAKWTGQQIWSGINVPPDHALSS